HSIAVSESTPVDGKRTFLNAWAAGARPTAVLAMSDIIALGVLSAAQELGLSVPEDLSIVGFDDIPAAQLCRPALTTVCQPTLEKGMLAARLLIDRQSGNERIEHRILPAALVVRESTAPARGAGPCNGHHA
ncbi:MAG TPA: substrate-binding domain-containing protein, partial [Chloroflexota bacterium]|nr:substrate-binding domain-containing protein [Chloroflexota bacterium]